jgi:hypothetical protein
MPKLSIGIPLLNGQEFLPDLVDSLLPRLPSKVPATPSRAVVQAMARHVDSLASDRARLRRMSQAGYSSARTQQWKDRTLLMEQFDRRVLARRGVNQTSS